MDGPGAPPALAPPPGNPRFPLVDSLRAIAALSVLVVHATILTGVASQHGYAEPLMHLNVGVTIFFVISGFLLYRPFVAGRRREGAPPPRLRDYARRRVLRIVPAYWVALTVLALSVGLNGVLGGDWWVYYGFLQIYPVAWDPATCTIDDLCGIPPSWSLAVEVSFYAVLPLLALGLGRLGRRGWVRRELLALGALAALSVAFQLWSVHATYEDHPSWFGTSDSLAGTFLWFALGMGLAVVSVASEDRERLPGPLRLVVERPLLVWALALGLFGALGYGLPPTVVKPAMTLPEQLAQHVGFGLVALLLVAPAVFGSAAGGLPRRVLANRALAWLGLISYGVFLWHYTILRELIERGALDWVPQAPFVVLVLAGTALAVIAGAASYYLVERPFLRLKDRPRPRAAATPPQVELAGTARR